MGAQNVGASRRGAWRFFAASIAAAVAAIATGGAFAGADSVKVRFGGDLASTRIVIDLDRSVQGRIVSGGDGGRDLVIEFPKLSGVDSIDGQGRGMIGAWSLDGSPMGAKLTVALNRGAVVEKRFLLAPGDGSTGYRYVIDLKATGAAATPRAPAWSPAAPGVQLASTPLEPLAAPERTPLIGKKTIVIDAGHGGHDPGALGAHAHEKDVTLATAKALKARLEKTGRYRVVLTRGDDTFVPLENRVQIARKAGANLFISLHADAGGNTQTRGASVYTLSDQGSDRVARRAATGGDGFLNIALPGGTKAVREILFDLTQRATRNKSGAFADLLISNVGDHAPLLTRAHRDARYVVLFAPDVPAVLLEMGFITNPQDEALLTDPAQRGRMAAGIADAIDEYFAREVRIAAR